MGERAGDGATRDEPWTLVMPEDGWDDRSVWFYCDLCERTVTVESVYLNLDALLAMGMTQAEFFLEVHRNDDHTWNEGTETWTK